MSFNIRCPYCNTVLEVDEQWVGMECECPQCRQKFVVPAPAAEEAPQAPKMQPPPTYRRSTPPPRQQYHRWNTPPQPQPSYQPPPDNETAGSDEEYRVYNPWGILLWSLFVPMLSFWFLKRSYEELDEPKRRGTAAVCFYLCIIHLLSWPGGVAISIIAAIINAAAVSSAVSVILEYSRFISCLFAIGALIDSIKFMRLLKREYAGYPIRYRSTWLPCGCLTAAVLLLPMIIALMLLPALNRAKERARRTACSANFKQTGDAIYRYIIDNHDLPPTFAALVNGKDVGSEIFKCPSSGKEYIYLGSGLKPCKSDIPIAMDIPGNHAKYVNILHMGGYPSGHSLPREMNSCVEILKELYPKLADSEEGRIVLKNARRADAALGRAAEAFPPEIAELYKTAVNGDAEAQYKMGLRCVKGDGIEEDPEGAVDWFRKAAEQGHAEAQYFCGLGHLYGAGNVAENRKALERMELTKLTRFKLQNPTAAVKWFRKAAEQGHAEAQYLLAWCCMTGNGTGKSLAEGLKWMRKAAGQGLAGAQCILGVCYLYGNGVEKDSAEGVRWLRKAAEQGYPKAKKILESLKK